MARLELNTNELDQVVGGAIVWKPDGTCFPKDNPDVIFHFDVNKIDEILNYIRINNGGKAHNLETLQMLKSVGYVW